VAILYLLNSTLCIEHEIADPEQFVSDFRAGKRNSFVPNYRL
jgi:hypothetical protein